MLLFIRSEGPLEFDTDLSPLKMRTSSCILFIEFMLSKCNLFSQQNLSFMSFIHNGLKLNVPFFYTKRNVDKNVWNFKAFITLHKKTEGPSNKRWNSLVK